MATNPYNRTPHNRPWPPFSAPSGPSTSQHSPVWHPQQPGRPPVDPAYANYGYGPRYNHPPSQSANPPMYSHPGPQQAYSPFHPQTMLQPPVPVPVPVNPSFQSQFVAIPLPAPHPIPMAPAYHAQQPLSRGGPSFASSRVRAQQNAGGPRGPRHDRNYQSHERPSSNQWSNPNPPFKEGPRPVPLGPRNSGRNASLPTAPRNNRQFPQRGRGRQSNAQRRRFGPGSQVNKGKLGVVAENTEASSSKQSSNKQENKRSFTDFKLVGWTIHDLGWTWGDVPHEIGSDDYLGNTENKENGINPTTSDGADASSAPAHFSSRLRFSFQPRLEVHGEMASTSLGGKRKKCEEDDDEIDIRKTRRRHSLSQPSPLKDSIMADESETDAVPGLTSERERTEDSEDSDWLTKAIGEEQSDHDGIPGVIPELDPSMSVGPDCENNAPPHPTSTEMIPAEITAIEEEIEVPALVIADGAEDVQAQSPESSPIKEEGESLSMPLHGSMMQNVEPGLFEDMAEVKIPLAGEEEISEKDVKEEDRPIDDITGSGLGEESSASLVQPKASGMVTDDGDAGNFEGHSITGMGPGALHEGQDTSEQTLQKVAGTDVSRPGATLTDTAGWPQTQNRLSILYADSQRRLTVDADIVESVKLFRSEGRFEIQIRYERDAALPGNSNVLLEVFSKDLQDFVLFKGPSEENDTAVPPFEHLDVPTILNLTLFLDTKRPLSEPGWCKSGNVEEWLSRELGRSTIPETWKNKITVVDPDEPPSLQDIISSWCSRASVGTPESRNRFHEQELDDPSRILEILLRIVRGHPNASNRLESGFNENPDLPTSLQIPSVLAISSIVDIAVDFAKQALGPPGVQEVHRRVREVIGKLPAVQLNRVLDAMFREYRT